MFSSSVSRLFLILPLGILPLGSSPMADVYSYMNDDGDYVISKERPEGSGEYAVLSDEGEFIELIRRPELNVPITHWRPWYLPAEPNPLDPPTPEGPAEPNVIIEEVDDLRSE
jgi:hypothetical protein